MRWREGRASPGAIGKSAFDCTKISQADYQPEEQAKLPFPLIDEEIYEPPTDAEPEETLEEVTERVVGNMPRVNAIEALHGYARIR